MPLPYGKQYGSEPGIELMPDVGSFPDQQLNNVEVSLGCRPHQNGLILSVFRFHSGAALQKGLHNVG